MLDGNAWAQQSASLVEVQKRGSKLEETVRAVLGWPAQRLEYDSIRGYTLQIDALYSNLGVPEVFASVTYTSPDNKGHSNENKVQLKIGELALLKYAYPSMSSVLVIGGSRDAWLPYVLTVFEHFYDEVIYIWDEPGRTRLRDLGRNPRSVQLRNEALWEAIGREWRKTKLAPPGTPIPKGLVRYEVLDALRQQKTIASKTGSIENEIARLCFDRSRQFGGTEWANYQAGAWSQIEMSRSYFNPVEAMTEIVLTNAGLVFQGGIAQDVQVRSLLHDFGMTTTKMSEDFVLFSEGLQREVRIQCKSSGGGRQQHGKNIQNRTKEQIARSIFYRCRYINGEIIWGPKNYHWIAILDGDWGVTKRHPYKYIHMLQLAGYDGLFSAAELLTPDLNVKRNNRLIDYLVSDLKCRRRTT